VIGVKTFGAEDKSCGDGVKRQKGGVLKQDGGVEKVKRRRAQELFFFRGFER